MFVFKKFFVIILALMAGAAYAGTMDSACSSGKVKLSCEKQSWYLSVQALYLQVSLGDNNLTGYITSLNDIFSNTYNDGTPHYNWGFRIDGTYYFSSGNDLSLNWSEINNNNQYSFFDSVGNLGNQTDYGLLGATNDYSVNPNWNVVNLEFGQKINLKHATNIRMHAGLEYLRLIISQSNTQAAVSGNFADQNIYFVSSTDFNGVGPRIGMDLDYLTSKGFTFYVNGALALLAGTQFFEEKSPLPPQGQLEASYEFYTGSLKAVVPSLEGKLGLNYNYFTQEGLLTVDAGWMWLDYLNARTYQHLTYIFPNGLPVKHADFGIQGPYIGAKWAGYLF